MLVNRKILLLFALVEATVALVPNATRIDNGKSVTDTRRKKKHDKSRSTSSSSGERKSGSDESLHKESLGLSDDSEESSEQKKSDAHGNIFGQAIGWRKWHRVCTPCPEDMKTNYKSRRIQWICGAYQRARRSFKSRCMMQYRNCQDGTMFVKIQDGVCHRPGGVELGEHFFYDYEVRGSDSSSNTDKGSSEYDTDNK